MAWNRHFYTTKDMTFVMMDKQKSPIDNLLNLLFLSISTANMT